MPQVLAAIGRDGAGPGLLRWTGSFAESSTGTIITTRPSKGNFTVVKKATGVYVVTFTQATLSVVEAGVSINTTAAIVGAGAVGLATANPGYASISGDYLTTDAGATHYALDKTNKSLLVLVFNAANNALATLYSLGNTSSVPNYRLSFDVVLSTSTMNQ